ncbi:MAG: hypothetical protein NVSMB32_13100 [Actinomycetota bacterium]
MPDPDPAAHPPGEAPLPSLIGRGPELVALESLLAGAARGEGRMVTLEGEAGIGKTLLLETTLAQAHARGFRCFVGAAEELERHRPFGVMAESLGIGRRVPVRRGGGAAELSLEGEDTRRGEIARLLAGEGPSRGTSLLAAAPEAEFRIVDALIDFVEHLCDAGPVVVALDDLQWADPSTLLALNRLGREISRLPAVLMATMRPLPRSTDLHTLLEGLWGRGALRLTLGKLSDAAMADLLTSLIGARPGERLLSQLARAGGNPFFAKELLSSLQREGAISRVDGVAEVADTHLPSSLTDTILQRLSFLSEDALEVLQVASILGSSFSVADLASAVGSSVATLAPILASAVRAGILGDDGPLLSFCHDLIRQALYLSLSPALRAWLHLAAAHVLAEAGRSHEEVAEHVVRGAARGDHAAAEWLSTAAGQAAGRSPAVAAELLQRALDVAPAQAAYRAGGRAVWRYLSEFCRAHAVPSDQ